MNLQEQIYRRSPAWAQNVLLNAHAHRIRLHRYGRPYQKATTRLREQERWSADHIREYQDARLQKIVQIAYNQTRYYREVMDAAGLDPADIRGTADLHRLPLLTKETVRARGADMMTAPKPGRDWLRGHTSGTTGTPLSLWYDRQTCIMTNAVDRRHKWWVGMRDGDWIGLLLGRVVVPPDQQTAPFWRVNRVQRQVWFSSFHMSDETLNGYAGEIRRRGLRFLEGYPSTLFVLADYLVRHSERLPMQAVITSSETLHTVQRERIEEAFQCRLFDFYALAERVIYAGECEAHEGKHVADEYGHTEVVDEAGDPVPDGESGYLVGTSLHNTAMPMIRYQTSDVSAIFSQRCACGRELRRMRDVATKAEDMVVTPEGRLISPSVLTHPFKPLHGIKKSQIVQENATHLVVKLVTAAEFTAAQERSLIEGIRERVGPELSIDVTLVDDIPREASGKFRWVISRVSPSQTYSWETASP